MFTSTKGAVMKSANKNSPIISLGQPAASKKSLIFSIMIYLPSSHT
jgi:hypothetical protein